MLCGSFLGRILLFSSQLFVRFILLLGVVDHLFPLRCPIPSQRPAQLVVRSPAVDIIWSLPFGSYDLCSWQHTCTPLGEHPFKYVPVRAVQSYKLLCQEEGLVLLSPPSPPTLHPMIAGETTALVRPKVTSGPHWLLYNWARYSIRRPLCL